MWGCGFCWIFFGDGIVAIDLSLELVSGWVEVLYGIEIEFVLTRFLI